MPNLPLHDHLAQPEVSAVRMTFTEIAKVIGADLPASARKHRAWWANETGDHVQAAAWLGAGFEVVEVDLERR